MIGVEGTLEEIIGDVDRQNARLVIEIPTGKYVDEETGEEVTECESLEFDTTVEKAKQFSEHLFEKVRIRIEPLPPKPKIDEG